MKNKKTLTIGIVAHNEENNIARLLKNLIQQQSDYATLEKIIVVCDGSSDNTVKEVKTVKNSRITLLTVKERMGKASGENLLFSKTNTDYLIILDADILPSNNFLNNFLFEFEQYPKINFLSAKIIPLKPESLVEKILNHSQTIIQRMYSSMRNTSPIYTCNGRALAYDKKSYKSLFLPKEIVSDDAYVYLYLTSKHLVYKQADKAFVFYRLPSNVKDHFKQSERFFKSRDQLAKYFSMKLVSHSFKIPVQHIVKSFVFGLFSNPFLTIAYVLLELRLKTLINHSTSEEPRWKIATSSKKIN